MLVGDFVMIRIGVISARLTLPLLIMYSDCSAMTNMKNAGMLTEKLEENVMKLKTMALSVGTIFGYVSIATGIIMTIFIFDAILTSW